MINPANKQRGVSLIELMIAISLGVVMMGAAIQFLVGTTQTYNLGDDISRVQENGRIALDILAKDVAKAGQNISKVTSASDFFQLDCTVTGSCMRDESQTGSTSDVLAIKYSPYPNDGTQVDCRGTTVPANIELVNVYTIANSGTVNSLYCRGFNATSGAWLTGSAMPLVDGIDQMQVLYRVTIPSSGPTAADTYSYVSGDQITTSNLAFVTAVKIGLLVSNGVASGSADNQTRSYMILDADQTDITDDHIRRIYSTTMQLNNAE